MSPFCVCCVASFHEVWSTIINYSPGCVSSEFIFGTCVGHGKDEANRQTSVIKARDYHIQNIPLDTHLEHNRCRCKKIFLRTLWKSQSVIGVVPIRSDAEALTCFTHVRQR